jgi:lipopolysaccharide/colanic/teichoic acid biosynthesis glycosyltransferase
MEAAAQGYPYAEVSDLGPEGSALELQVSVLEPELSIVEPSTTTDRIGASPVAQPTTRDVKVEIVRQPVAKRILDVALASVALAILAPFLTVLLVAVAADTGASPVFVQVRTGRGGKRFRMFKFRTMVADAESRLADLMHLNEVQWPMFKIRNDPRITKLGRFLRAASLDELPQLVNILKGDMSLVGPRPPLPHEVATYTSEQARRLSVLPGLTGLWQVSGRADCSFEQAVALDLHYIDHHHWRTDVAIMLRTFGAVIRRRGAY